MVNLLIITFRRIEETKILFNSIDFSKVDKLFVFSDNSRKDDKESYLQVTLVREFIRSFTKEIKGVEYFFSEENLGSKKGPLAAIDWFFANVDTGLILEDDCIPDKSFLKFVDVNLDVHKKNPNVLLISGFNPLKNNHNQNIINCFYSHYCPTWGWATWKDRWIDYRKERKRLSKPSFIKKINHKFDSFFEKEYWQEKFINVSIQKGEPTAWDFDLFFFSIEKNMQAVIPSVSLIKNIGYKVNSSHTNERAYKLLNQEINSLNNPQIDSKVIFYNKNWDSNYFLEVFYEGYRYRGFIKKLYLIYVFSRYYSKGNLYRLTRYINYIFFGIK